jgi:uncharacterized RDD family membrane protein YckC
MNELNMNYASIGKRFLALIIDGALLSLLGAIFFKEKYSFTGPGLSMGLIPLVVAWLYFALQDSSAHQATIGKRVMDIHIRTLGGEKVDFKTASIRYFSKLLSSLLFLFGYIMAFFSAERKTLHDRLANTLVVND